MKCSDVMTPNPAYCLTNDPVSKAARLMEQENVGSIPVVEHPTTKKLVGIVTDRDLALRVVGENRSPHGTHISEVMTRNPVTCYPDDDFDETLRVMSEHQVRRVPVVNHEGQVVGIIAQADVALRADNEHKTASVVEDISRPTEPVVNQYRYGDE